MSTIGRITIPELTATAVFPVTPDYGSGMAIEPEVSVHSFLHGHAKVDQRFIIGNGVRRFTVRKANLYCTALDSFKTFWEANAAGIFFYDAPNLNDSGTTRYTVRFADPTISFDYAAGDITGVGLTLIEVPGSGVTYTLNTTSTRFPSSGLQSALLDQTQVMIPLIKIRVRERAVADIYLSDRQVTIGSQAYLPRLLDWDGISQGISGESDEARFNFGNADRVMTTLANDCDLTRASVEFSLFHAGTGTKIDLWKGEITDWKMNAGPEFPITASDGLYELKLPYPARRISRTCWKQFKGSACPYAGGATSCNKSFAQCSEYGMENYFGGLSVKPQAVRTKDNSTGTWGYGRSTLTSSSVVSDSIYSEIVPQVWYNDPTKAFPINGKIVSGRDEGDFFDALSIICEGPIGAFGTGHTLDNQPHHGPGELGLRLSKGADPNPDEFSLGESNSWQQNAGYSTYGPERAAGTAFIEIRRKDESSLQLKKLQEHAVQAYISQGMAGYVWSAPGARTLIHGLTNPIWIAVNVILRAKGLFSASASDQEALFDVPAAIAAAAVCDARVPLIIGRTQKVWVQGEGDELDEYGNVTNGYHKGTYEDQAISDEAQFSFNGILQEQKPLRDWITEILANCLGFFTFSFGKLRLGTRFHSGATEAFTTANITMNSLELSALKPEFNHLTANFASAEYDFVGDNVQLYDIDHATLIGGDTAPLFTQSQLNLAGTTNKSQAARIVTARLREELGGISYVEWKRARQIAFKTTVLALNVEPGLICSLTHPDMPAGAGEFRVIAWKLNKDYSIDIQGRTTTDSMYDMLAGDKPVDVAASPIPVDVPVLPSSEFVWHPDQEQPASGDYMYSTDDKTFQVTQTPNTMADGTTKVAIEVKGKAPVNTFLPVEAPVIDFLSSDTIGGSLPGGKTYYVSVAAVNSDGKFTLPSNVLSFLIPAGTSTNKLALNSITWPAGTYAKYCVYACADDVRLLTKQFELTGTAPTSILLTAALLKSSTSFPHPRFRRLKIKAKEVDHDGVIGYPVDSVAANTITIPDLAGSDDWNGRDVSIIADRSDGSAAIWDFRVTAYTPATGQFTCAPDPQAAGIQSGDCLIIRTQPDVISSTTIGDSKFMNSQYSGFVANAEAGKLVMILAGPGVGQTRLITGNNQTTLTIDRPWDVMPTSASKFIVTAAQWQYVAESADIINEKEDTVVAISVPVDNLLSKTILVSAIAVDRDGYESPEEFSHIRETFLFGDFFTITHASRTVTADTVLTVADDTVLVDCSAGDVTITLPSAALKAGRDLTITRISDGVYTVFINAAGTDLINGQASDTLTVQWQSISIRGEA